MVAQQPSPARADDRGPSLPEGARILRDLEYVPYGHERHRLDLYLPGQGKDWPLLVWVHGGAWLGGSKERTPATRFLADGYAVASINYRLSHHTTFPAQIQDCKAAIRWLRAHAQEHGYDASRIGVWGSSAGGHLVALLGTTGDITEFDVGWDLEQSSAVQAVVDFFGPTDFLRMDEQAAGKGQFEHDSPDSPESLLVGGPIQENKEKVSRASPLSYISKGDPPFLVVHGDRDPLVPVQQSKILLEALEAAGVEAELHIVKGGGHGFRDAEVDRKVSVFLDIHLKSPLPEPLTAQ